MFTQFIFGTAILSVILMAIFSYTDHMSGILTFARERQAFLSLQNQIAFSLKNPPSYRKVLMDSQGSPACNPTLACILTNDDCAVTLGNLTDTHPISCFYSTDGGTLVFD